MILIESPKDLVNLMLAARLEQGVTQTVVADALMTRQSHLCDRESGGDCSLEFALKWAAALGYRLALVPMDRHPFEDEPVKIVVQ